MKKAEPIQSLQFTIYRLLLEFAISVVIDVGASLWLFDFVKRTKSFSYALLMLVIIAFVFLIAAYFLQ